MFYPARRPGLSGLYSYWLPASWLVFLVSISSFPVYSQGGIETTGTGGQNKVRGRIYFQSGRRSDNSSIKVSLESTSSERLTLIADPNGSFIFDSLAPGSYHLTVDAGKEYEPSSETILIEQLNIRSRNMSGGDIGRINSARTFNVIVTLRLKSGYSTKAGVINAADANIPAAASEAYQRAMEAARTGDNKKAVEELKRAIAYHATFISALNELGVQYLKLGQANKAAEVLSSGVKVAPEEFQLRLNYGVALLNQRKFVEAEEQLRVAVNKNSSVPTAHMYLGIVLAVQRKLDEAKKELELAISSRSNDVAMAHRYLGGVYLERREYKLAAEQLETYLRLYPKAADSEVLQQKIKELRSKT